MINRIETLNDNPCLEEAATVLCCGTWWTASDGGCPSLDVGLGRVFDPGDTLSRVRSYLETLELSADTRAEILEGLFS